MRLERELEREAFPYIGASPVGEITAPDLLGPPRRGTQPPDEGAHRLPGLRSGLHAVAMGRAERDISADLRGALPPVKTEHFATITDPKAVDPLLRWPDTYSGTLPVRCALRLAPLVFARLRELVAAEWPGIDLARAGWRALTAAKSHGSVAVSYPPSRWGSCEEVLHSVR